MANNWKYEIINTEIHSWGQFRKTMKLYLLTIYIYIYIYKTLHSLYMYQIGFLNVNVIAYTGVTNCHGWEVLLLVSTLPVPP